MRGVVPTGNTTLVLKVSSTPAAASTARGCLTPFRNTTPMGPSRAVGVVSRRQFPIPTEMAATAPSDDALMDNIGKCLASVLDP